MSSSSHAIVVGAGFVGLSCALRIQQIHPGASVTLLDASAPASKHAASFGNAGTFAPYANVPIARPGLWRDALRMMLVPTKAGAIPPPLSVLANTHLPALTPWLIRLLRNCHPTKVRSTALALGAILARAETAYNSIFDAAGIDIDGSMGMFASNESDSNMPFALRNGYLLMHSGASSMQGSKRAAALRREGLGKDLRMEQVDVSGILELEPGLNSDFVRDGGAWFFPDGWCLREPGALLRALSSAIERNGGELRSDARVDAVGTHDSDHAFVRLANGEILTAGVVVVATGARSAALAATAGDYVPLDTERGHSITFAEGTERLLTRAVCSADAGFILTPMSGGLRAAGLVELGGLHAPMTRARCDQLESVSRTMIRSQDALGDRDESKDWLGFRPTLPDAIPVIGPSVRHPRIFYSFGHQHVGWTLGGISAYMIEEMARPLLSTTRQSGTAPALPASTADLVSHAPIPVRFDAYRVNRF